MELSGQCAPSAHGLGSPRKHVLSKQRQMRYTKYIAIAALAAAALLAGCADDEQQGMVDMPEAVVEAENTANNQSSLTPEQQLMKQQLDAAAQLLVAALNKPTVQRELHQLDYEKMRTDRLSFEQLLRNPAKDGSFHCLATELSRSLNAGAKSGNNLVDYLIEQGCELYLPMPLDFYEDGASITVAGHPVDNDEEGVGYVHDAVTGSLRAVVVNNDYADKHPVAIIMEPQKLAPVISIDPDLGGGGRPPVPIPPTPPTPAAPIDIIGADDFPEDRAGKICKIEIAAVHWAVKPGLFSMRTDLVIGRTRDNNQVQRNPIFIPYSVAKAAAEGWSVHSNGGWVDLETPYAWDMRWYCKYVEQIFYAYAERGKKEVSISGSVKYKDYVNISIGIKDVELKDAEATFVYKGNWVTHQPLDRTSFIKSLQQAKTRTIDGEEWPLFGFGALTVAMRVVWL